ncbi:hypothetical protein BTRA_5276 [Burkholderia thailandensis USAMRU Malaysia |nr:hypothetical protein BTQ_3513 [Burkholderia thailandensis 2002721723]AHI82271.1 hypothetical protein BTJ_4550 [Burkholderia thailandensis E444]AIC89719.1 hypothetical protein BTRA_5276 [Burkholderia thailandensis USAMRU Malaysia \
MRDARGPFAPAIPLPDGLRLHGAFESRRRVIA